jgi:DNA-binding PadR family transcriptional regulator
MSYAIGNPRLARRMMMSRGGRRGRGRGRGFGPWGEMPMGPGYPGRGYAKVRRGDVRSAILYLLSEKPMHGYQIMQELSERTNGAWKPSAGSIYPNLQQLEDEDLIVASDVSGKKVFELTEAGREEIEADPKGPPWERFESHEAYAALRDAGFGVGAAVMQIARTGTEDQVVRTREILEETRRQIYQLLADEDTD